MVIDDLSASKYRGSGNLFQISSALTTRSLNNVLINHVTGIADPNHGVLSIGGLAANPLSSNITITNNMFLAGNYTVWSTGMLGMCSTSGQPLTLFSACWNPYLVTTNAFILPSSQGNAAWPAGNQFPANVAAVQFTNYNNGNGGDYTLLPSSPYKNANSDGKDLGADISTVMSYVADVQ